jgi:mono/diheme cytochrome c family protein
MSRSLPIVRRSRNCFTFLLLLGAGASAMRCASSAVPQPATAPEPGASEAPAAAAPDDARGGRLFDNWRAEKQLGDTFTADAAKTPEPDGKGGPNGNGTLNDGAGRPLANSGHDYRLKNLFGWDLRGAEGVYGPAHQNKAYVLPRNLLTDTRSAAELQRWLAAGDEHLPAYGQVLDAKDLADLTAFLVKTRDGALARPENVYELKESVPKNYSLLPGADVTKGRERFSQSCAKCHGPDGRKLPIDEVESVGTLARSSAYEIWFKIQHGHPGSAMERQVSEPTGAANGQAVLDILAALCDRTTFPALAGKESADVADGDARCGAHLK